ncbi:UDP-N-acetylglucosamine 2-epimerase [Flavobacterium sp.]|jgi:UDP-hydrolysing UDP-N-acetyl-D-glucosamine 2-epimerase|uniref:UDP-N-acetylglucosamine 2-epimerase n=1 Tax=Flavobacterium sp. TaxID=239 RepID=UPI0037C0BDAD
MKKICVFVGSRANYSSIKSVMMAVQNHPQLQLQLIIGSSAVLDRFGKVEDLIIKDGFTPNFNFYNIVEGENPVTMAKSTGLGLIECSMIFNNLKPDYLVVVGDRFEMMSVTIAAAYMNIRIAHTMGGEVTGTIDESIRHAITKFAHVHFAANEDARKRIIKLGEEEQFVFNVGCPRIDLVARELERDSDELLDGLFANFRGVGPGNFDLNKPFLLVSQHPVTTEFGNNRKQIDETLFALAELKMPTIMLWPNIDAGSDDISSGIRSFREKYKPDWLHLFKNLPTPVYIHLMKKTACLVGNSSSGVREGAIIGTPVVNIGSRQHKRLAGTNSIDVGYDCKEIKEAIQKQVKNGPYPADPLYGSGDAGEQIAKILATINPPIQKTITY